MKPRFQLRANPRNLVPGGLLLGLGLTVACSMDVPAKNVFPPAGLIRGTLVYVGPPPCTRTTQGRRHVVGNANILVFDTRQPPPPDGLASRSYRIAVVDGDILFRDISGSLYYPPEIPGDPVSMYCPPEGAPNVTASARWELAPVDAGTYQIRGFYDRDGDFQAAFRFSNLPTLGDVGGGAVANATQALAGAPAVYSTVTVGVPMDVSDPASGESRVDPTSPVFDPELKARCQVDPCTDPLTGEALAKCPPNQPRLCIPDSGYLVENVLVAYALRIPLQRPYFHVAELQGPKASLTDAALPAAVKNPGEIVVPVDYKVKDANPLRAQDYLFTIRLQAGVPASEKEAAKAAPFLMHVDSPGMLMTAAFDLNRDGKFDAADHVIGSDIARALWPLISFTKLDPSDPIKRTGQDKPRILSAGVTTYDDRLTNLIALGLPTPEAKDHISAVIRPTAICIPDASDPNGPTVVVTPWEKDENQEPVIALPDQTAADLALQLRRNKAGVKIINLCLPPADLALNVIYAPTGQAWTIPNESGVCMPGEVEDGPTSCVQRTPSEVLTRSRLASQLAVLRFGRVQNDGYCASQVDAHPDQAKIFWESCMTPQEQKAFATPDGSGPDTAKLRTYWKAQ